MAMGMWCGGDGRGVAGGSEDLTEESPLPSAVPGVPGTNQ